MIKKYIGNLVSLAPVTDDCIELWTKWLNDPEITIPLGDEAYNPITIENQKESVKNSANNHIFSIIDNKSEKIIGRCMIFNIDFVNNRGTIGIFIGDKEKWNKGYGEDSLKLLLDYSFCILNMNNIMLGVLDFNKRAIQCYKKIGFKEIGIRRETRKINNKRYNALFMDIIANEYKPYYLGKIIGDIINK